MMKLQFAVLLFVVLLISSSLQAETKTLLFMIDDGFNHNEFQEPYAAFSAAGYEIVVAAPKTGAITSGNRGRPDAHATITLADVKVADYFALMIPGGHAPAKLIKHDHALRVTREFAKADKPIAAVCHGPMLLLEAGLLRNRPFTCLWSVKDERPDYWQENYFGSYHDQPVVADEKYITGRHVADLGAFIPATLEHFAKHGGHPVLQKPAPVVVVADSGKLSGHEKWMLSRGMRPAGIEVTLVDEVMATDLPVHLHQGEVTGNVLKTIGEKARAAAPAPDEAEALTEYTAAIVIDHGFNAAIAETMRAFLDFQGHRTAVVAEKAGWYRSINGAALEAQPMNNLKLSKQAILVAPGVVWPVAKSDEAEAEDPEAAKPVDPRLQWMLDHHAAGGRLIAFGYDTLQLAEAGQWKDAQFASSAQAMWYFRRTGNKYSRDAVQLTAPRFITASTPEALPEAMKMIAKHFTTAPAPESESESTE